MVGFYFYKFSQIAKMLRLPIILSYMVNFIIGKIAGGVGRPEIVGGGLGTDAKVTITNIQETAGSTTTFEIRLAIFQFGHKGVADVGPYFREFSLADVTETMMSPELVGMNRTVPTDTADTDAGTIAAVHLQKPHHLFGSLGLPFA